MLCDRCHGREAVVHVTQIVNGHRTERHLCRECAARENLVNNCMGFFGHDLFRNSFDPFFNDGFMDSLFRPARTAIENLSCPECGKTATGKFCPECGTARPADNGWVCTCGAHNTGRFCSECGAKKPEAAPRYKCDKCGWVPEDPTNPPKFCPECGNRFDENDIVR